MTFISRNFPTVKKSVFNVIRMPWYIQPDLCSRMVKNTLSHTSTTQSTVSTHGRMETENSDSIDGRGNRVLSCWSGEDQQASQRQRQS